MTTEQEITRLTALWYEYVGLDHHKDRDCHWYINKVWSYGDKPYYRIEHYGYVYTFEEASKNYGKKLNTYAEAEKSLLQTIKDAMNQEYKRAKEIFKATIEWDNIQIKQAKWAIENFIKEVKGK